VSRSVHGIVLAGVHRWGESLFERLLPRPLLPVADSPLICYGLRWLRDADVRAVTICANSDSRLVHDCLGDGTALGLDLYYYEDLMPRGPAGSVRDAGLAWGAHDFVVIEGSVVPTGELGELLAAHRSQDAAITIAVEAAADSGPAAAALRPAGMYVFGRRALEAVPATGYQDIKEVLIPRLHGCGERVLAYPIESPCPRVLGVETYLAANRWMITRLVNGPELLPRYWRVNGARVHASARVASPVRMIGPVLIGPESRIASGVTLVGPTVVGQGCVVGEGAVVSRSVVWDYCRIGRHAVVDQCILAHGAAVEAEARTSTVLHVPKAVARPAGMTAGGGLRQSVRADGDRRAAGPPGGHHRPLDIPSSDRSLTGGHSKPVFDQVGHA